MPHASADDLHQMTQFWAERTDRKVYPPTHSFAAPDTDWF